MIAPRAGIAALALAACGLDASTGRARQAVVDGAATEQDLAVVALLVPGEADAFCTGTLISPGVVLTAAHCLARFGPDAVIAVHLGADYRAGGARRSVAAFETHPDWQGGLGRYDLAMLLLGAPFDPLVAMPLFDGPIDDHFGQPYRVVGFGRHDRTDPDPDGRKRQGTTRLTGYVADSDVVVAGDEVALCFGDSGGPGLLTDGGVERLAGVHSFTAGLDCQPPAADTRVDLHADAVIRPFIDRRDPACAADALCAPIGCTDDPDCGRCDLDGVCTEDCAGPDPDCPALAAGQPCRVDAQCEDGLCLAWSGDVDRRACAAACDASAPSCAAGSTCRAVPPRGAACVPEAGPAGAPGDGCRADHECGSALCRGGVCAAACDPALEAACADGLECAAGEPIPVCVAPAGSGGCAAGGPTDGAPLGIALLAALLAAGQRGGRPRGRLAATASGPGWPTRRARRRAGPRRRAASGSPAPSG